MIITKDRFAFVPIVDFTEPWTDEKLYKKYGLTEEEIAFIESMIRPMENSQNQDSLDLQNEQDLKDENE